MKKKLFEKIIKGNFKIIMDGGGWNYDRFGFGELEGKVYRVELEGEGNDNDVFELKKGLSIEGIIKEGEDRGFWEIEGKEIYYDEERENEMGEWLNILNK